MILVQATTKHLEDLIPLFDGYRVFYKKPSDLKGARKFLMERLSQNDAVIFIAFEEGKAMGFTQLYKTFSSTTMEPFYILNDLFVHSKFRNKGVGEALLRKAQEFCTALSFKGLALETANDNPAQHLYEKLNWKKDTEYLHYFWNCPKQ